MSISDKVMLIERYRDKNLVIGSWHVGGGIFDSGEHFYTATWKGVLIFKQSWEDPGLPSTSVDRYNKEAYDYIEKIYRPIKRARDQRSEKDRAKRYSPVTDEEIEILNRHKNQNMFDPDFWPIVGVICLSMIIIAVIYGGWLNF